MPLRKKGNGRSIMVSDFLTSSGFACFELSIIVCCYVQIMWCRCGCVHHVVSVGRLVSPNHEARVLFLPGTNYDGWWDQTSLIAQLRDKAIPAFKELFPDKRGVFIFDNSTSHGAYAPDALLATRMNVGGGGKQPKLRNGWFVAQTGEAIEQSMQDDAGLPKGMHRVLEERGLLAARGDGNRWKGLCGKGKCDHQDEPLSNPAVNPGLVCCMTRLLSIQPDFAEQKCAVEVRVSVEFNELFTCTYFSFRYFIIPCTALLLPLLSMHM